MNMQYTISKSEKIYRIILSLVLFFIFATIIARCQQYTTVSGTIVDSDSVTWINGSWHVELQNPRGGQVTFIDAPGTPVVTQFSGVLSNSGTFSQSSIPNNSDLAPAGTSWVFTFCPDASYQCTTLNNIAFTAGQNTFDISSTATAQIKPPRFPALGHQSWGYADVEITPIPNVGGIYFNVESEGLKYWDGTEWDTISTSTSGSNIQVNGSTVNNPNFNSTTPAPDSGYTPVSWKVSGSSVLGEVPNTSANGVQYNPSTTAYVFTGSSINEDDNRVTSSAIAVTSWSCNGTICTVITSAAHGLVAGDWVDVSPMTGWFAVPTGLGAQDSGVGTFQVLSSGLTSTQFEFAYTTNTGSGSGGSIYSANYWGPYLASKMPYLNGHGTTYWRFAWASDCANTTTFNEKYGSITGSPKYFIFNGAQNDLLNGDSDTQIEGYLQTCWQNAHNAGFIVLMAPIVTTFAGGSPPASYSKYKASVNQWLPSQAKSYFNVAGGKYFDKYIDLNSYALSMNTISTIEGNSATGGYYFAERINEAFGTQGGSVNGPPPMMNYDENSNTVDFWNGPNGVYASGWQFLDFNHNQVLYISATAGIDTVNVSGWTFEWDPFTSAPSPWLNVPTAPVNGLSGLGSGGEFKDTWIGETGNAGYFYSNSLAGDIITNITTVGKAWLIGTTSSNTPTATFSEGHLCVGGSRTCGQPFSTNSFGQLAANNTGGTCAMAAATTCTITLGTTYTTPVCIATQQTAASPIAASCSVSGTTVTITAASSNSSTWGAFVFGNPN